MESIKLFEAIEEAIKKNPKEYQPYKDLFDLCVGESTHSEMVKICHTFSYKLRQYISRELQTTEMVQEFYDLYKNSLLFDAPYSFDAFMLYIELDRLPSERFYQPRRKILKPLVDALQQLEDDELDELFLSMPPRVGKSTMVLFFMVWVMGRHPESTNLYSAFSDSITQTFYAGVLEILRDEKTYKFKDVFPTITIATTNSKEETLDLNRPKRLHTLTARSLYGTLNGSCDCNNILVADDLLSGIEEALNPDRLTKAWMLTDNNLLARAKGKAKILWVGTRWSINDPIGKRIDIIESSDKFVNHRYRIINVPALNEKDESNFDYSYGVGFSTEIYHQKRASFERNNDFASWTAQYMGEPIEREGTLFEPDGFRYYNGVLPEGEPDRIFLACDPAWGGGDSVAAPICCQYGNDIYVHDVVFTNEDKSKSWPLLADKIIKNNVHTAQFEGTKATETFQEGVQKILKDKGYRCNILSKPASTKTSKEQRIYDKAPDIREMMIFREPNCRSKEYNLFMMEVFSFKMEGKNKHDDAPDSLAMAMDMVLRSQRKAEVFKRPF